MPARSLTSPTIRLPHVTLPKLRWPRLSPGARAILMMGLMISPAFVSDYIGYGVERLFYTPGQIAEMRAPDDAMLTHVEHFSCCLCRSGSIRRRISDNGPISPTRNGWPRYPQAGETCFRPDRVLLGVVGLKTFNVACPTMVLSVADRQRWMTISPRSMVGDPTRRLVRTALIRDLVEITSGNSAASVSWWQPFYSSERIRSTRYPCRRNQTGQWWLSTGRVITRCGSALSVPGRWGRRSRAA